MSSVTDMRDQHTLDHGHPWRLIITTGLWESALHGLISTPDAQAIGPLRWLNVSDARELLVEGLQVTTTTITGESRPTGSAWFVVATSDRIDPATLHHEIAARGLQPSQICVLLLIDRQSHRRWLGIVAHQHRIDPLTEIHIIGPRSVRIQTAAEMTAPPDPRWSRTVGALGERTWNLVNRATITMIGAGRMGTSLAWQFAALGIKRLRLFDPDHLAVENLDAMPGLSASDVGLPKVQALAKALLRFRPDLEIVVRPYPTADRDTRRLLRERCDLLVTAVDDDTPRYLAACIARECLFPHLDVASDIQRDASGQIHLTADARLLLPGAGCVQCVGGIHDLPAVLRQLSPPRGAMPDHAEQPWFEHRAGSLITLNQMISGAAVQSWLDLLSGDLTTSFWQRIAWNSGRGMESHSGPVGRGDLCPVCLRTHG